ncbi:pyridine nucleotide-disulfide oxidoreductase [Sphingomonas ginkgonis]|uniref:Pyridine nucleotide-disulfide oxidoreductase n=1 Tax=Sphingomonas ginkgonis TaxID=2315330 RepID=A0A3S0EKS8_9SPHN|nr:FAD-dependent oxidoreductase [Sphingomonas ginkgonis]RST29907.1 pyridine nucleotide-disulfide oxidoreductase [Sphingomonas ginkgonis]
MRHVAVIGSGPAGFYTAEALVKAYGAGARIDILDRLPVPYGLIRFGVAPDHQSIKAVAKRYEKVALEKSVRFLGNVHLGADVSVEELLHFYDAVVLATGAPHDRRLGIPGDDLPGVIGSAAFVGWYNGHPDHAELKPRLDGTHAVVVGNGNVALDVARILAKTEAEFAGSDIVDHALAALRRSSIRRITILGRRGPHQIAMTPKELGELGHLGEAVPLVEPGDLPLPDSDGPLEPGQRKSVALLREFAANPPDGSKPKTIAFDFFAKPLAIEGIGRAERVRVERTALSADGQANGTGETYELAADLVVSCIGYQSPAIPGVPYDDRLGRFPNDHGLVAERLWSVGWARRGPTGTIGTNRPDGQEVAEQIAAAFPPGGAASGREGGASLDRLLASRGCDPLVFADWQKIEAAEAAAARSGSPREKLVRVEELLRAGGR